MTVYVSPHCYNIKGMTTVYIPVFVIGQFDKGIHVSMVWI
jgi:hypothetical protein